MMNLTTLSNLIDKSLGSSTDWEIQSVEKMEQDKEPIVRDVKSNSEIGKEIVQEIVQEIDKTDLKRLRSEEGMEIQDALYTITLTSDSNTVTYTVNNDSELHANASETTYSIRNKDSKLYSLLEEAYSGAK